MCGRFAITSDLDELARHFQLVSVAEDLSPHHNIAPTQGAPVIRLAADGTRRIELIRWGLIPHWARDPSIGARLINARAETVHAKPAFRQAFARRRCLVVANGFYEWQRTNSGKQPYWIHFDDGRPMALAGLWERWQDSDGTAQDSCTDSCTIVTTEANALVQLVHNRMPVIIAPQDYATWLARPGPQADTLRSLLRPAEAMGMRAIPVSTHVNTPTHDDPSCIEATGPPLRVGPDKTDAQ